MSNFNIPEKLNKNLFEKALEKKFKKPVKINSYEVSAASKKGDNYTSDIYRARIYLNNGLEEISLIVKYSLESEKLQEFFDELQVIEKEIEMYEKILPKFDEISEEKFAAECYQIEGKPTVFIFEDLKDLGFDVCNRFKGLNLEHCKIFMEKLGKFHAVSMILLEKEPNIFKTYSFGMYKDTNIENNFIDYTIASFKDIIEIIQDRSGFENITRALEKLVDNFRGKILNCMNQSSDLKVLNHGDLWTNNVMFKYGEGPDKAPTDVLFVDFQNSYFTSLALDYQYFLYTAPTQEVRHNCEEELLGIYCESLAEALKKLNHLNIPSVEEIRVEIRKYDLFGLCTAIAVLPSILMEKPEGLEFDVEDVLCSDEFRKEMNRCPRFLDVLEPILRKFEANGVFDM